jgi:manganese oxidase
MGHGIPNLIGVEPGKLDERVRKVIPGYMTMGESGMGEMGDMGMQVPANSIPMLGGRGKHDVITMGGMFTVLKTRDRLHGHRDPGWYDAPPATIATGARAADLQRDGIDPDRPPPIDDQTEE